MLWSTIIMAIREIRRNKLRSVLTTLGIVIGVGSVIALVTLGRGVTTKVTSDIQKMGTNLLIIVPGSERRGPTATAAQPFKFEDARAIEAEVSAIDKVAPSINRGALIVAGNRNWSSAVTGSTNAFFEVRGYEIELGHPFTEAQLQGLPVCILGATVRNELYGPQNPVGSSIRVGQVSCTVVGIMAAKGQNTFGNDQDDFVLMPLQTMQRRITGSTDVGVMFASARSNRLTTKAKSQIEMLMRERRHVPPGRPNDFTVQDMKEISNTLGNVTGVMTALLGAIASVSLIVGGIGIMNIMLVSVTERTREIGIRLSIGARAREVLLQFLVEAVTLSTLGGILGIAFGLGASLAATHFLNLPFGVQPDIILIAFGFSGAVGVAFGFFPARKASRLNPIEALRHE